jgi:excinuclease UvrABC ATPase subunit
MDKYKVGVEFKPGGGSYYDSATNKMVIDSHHAADRAALAFVHEMNHAEYHHKGISADVKAMDRDTYIKKMVQEEAEGVVKSIEAKQELVEAKEKITATYPLEAEYEKAYKEAVDAEKKANPKATADDLKKKGREAGCKRVVRGFMDGEIVTSNTSQTYPDYYGSYWDKANAKTKAP